MDLDELIQEALDLLDEIERDDYAVEAVREPLRDALRLLTEDDIDGPDSLRF